MSVITQLLLVVMIVVPVTISIGVDTEHSVAAAETAAGASHEGLVAAEDEEDADLPWPIFVAGAFLIPAAFLLVPSLLMRGEPTGH